MHFKIACDFVHSRWRSVFYATLRLLLLSTPFPILALPTDGVVRGGDAQLNSQANTLTITQTTPKVALEWSGFSSKAWGNG